MQITNKTDTNCENGSMEEKLKENELRYRTIFESSADAIMTLEPPLWKFSQGNQSTLKMFMAKDEAEFSSAEPWKLSPERQPDGKLSSDKAKEMIEGAMRDGSKLFEWTHKRLNGEDFPANVLLTRISLGNKTFLQATVRDITEVKKTEEKLREKIAELEKLNDLMVGRELKMVELKAEMVKSKEQKNT
jgi:PAS domain S-box-containing protein